LLLVLAQVQLARPDLVAGVDLRVALVGDPARPDEGNVLQQINAMHMLDPSRLDLGKLATDVRETVSQLIEQEGDLAKAEEWMAAVVVQRQVDLLPDQQQDRAALLALARASLRLARLRQAQSKPTEVVQSSIDRVLLLEGRMQPGTGNAPLQHVFAQALRLRASLQPPAQALATLDRGVELIRRSLAEAPSVRSYHIELAELLLVRAQLELVAPLESAEARMEDLRRRQMQFKELVAELHALATAGRIDDVRGLLERAAAAHGAFMAGLPAA
jgi:hypothetical protein